MKKILAYTLTFIISLSIMSTTVFAGSNLEFYLEPQGVEANGEIKILLKLKNIAFAIPKGYNGISLAEIHIEFDKDAMYLKKKSAINIAGEMLVTNVGDISYRETSTGLVVYFSDGSVKNRTITRDGTVCEFIVYANRPLELQNSNIQYKMEVNAEKTKAYAYNKENHDTVLMKNIKAWDNYIGGSGTKLQYPQAQWQNESITFAENEIMDGYLPLRKTFENFGYNVKFNGENEFMEITGNGDRLSVKIDENTAFVNRKILNMDKKLIIKNDVTYIDEKFAKDFMGIKSVTPLEYRIIK